MAMWNPEGRDGKLPLDGLRPVLVTMVIKVFVQLSMENLSSYAPGHSAGGAGLGLQ